VIYSFLNFSSSQQQIDNIVTYQRLNDMISSTTLTNKNGNSINNKSK
jgi:hypothetical protein